MLDTSAPTAIEQASCSFEDMLWKNPEVDLGTGSGRGTAAMDGLFMSVMDAFFPLELASRSIDIAVPASHPWCPSVRVALLLLKPGKKIVGIMDDLQFNVVKGDFSMGE